ncbi:MAG TPA: hypothetical protein VNS22_10780 [Geminicoccus sp.]|uniref:hypothetical protein n=1 Tax=Geminicoccus sp. TaxID=2024832 RepID=UPI002C2E6845|nr:hypothetical protein [Geminicoccus sp.]HWL68855.1 hypothetical protein [Geminicoccus sp.]
MLGLAGQVQKQGTAANLVAERLEGPSGLLASLGSRDQPRHLSRDVCIRELRLGSAIKVPTRDFQRCGGCMRTPGLEQGPRLDEVNSRADP